MSHVLLWKLCPVYQRRSLSRAIPLQVYHTLHVYIHIYGCRIIGPCTTVSTRSYGWALHGRKFFILPHVDTVTQARAYEYITLYRQCHLFVYICKYHVLYLHIFVYTPLSVFTTVYIALRRPPCGISCGESS